MKKLLLSISFLSLVGVSAISYAGWTKFGTTYEPGKPTPKGDCLETICEYGCIEDDAGNGLCCSAGNKGEKCYGGLCCKEGLMCSSIVGEGTCVECMTNSDCPNSLVCNTDHTCVCPANTVQYTKPDNTRECCDTTNHVLATIPNSTSNACCSKLTPIWDPSGQKCVECLTDQDCTGESVCTPEKVCSCKKSKDCNGELTCNPNQTCGCPADKPINRDGICIACSPSQVPNADKTDCVCANGLTEEFCASRGQHLYDETCVCAGCLRCPREKHNNNGVCEACPIGTKKTTDDFEKCQGKPKCNFDSSDAVGCCEIVTASAYEHCKSGNGAFHGYKLGNNMQGRYNIEYVGGQWTCGRYGTSRRWCTTASKSCGCETFLRIKTNGSYTTLRDSNQVYCRGESYIYWQDGPVWSSCGVSGDGCTDNCGKISFLFQKVS